MQWLPHRGWGSSFNIRIASIGQGRPGESLVWTRCTEDGDKCLLFAPSGDTRTKKQLTKLKDQTPSCCEETFSHSPTQNPVDLISARYHSGQPSWVQTAFRCSFLSLSLCLFPSSEHVKSEVKFGTSFPQLDSSGIMNFDTKGTSTLINVQ